MFKRLHTHTVVFKSGLLLLAALLVLTGCNTSSGAAAVAPDSGIQQEGARMEPPTELTDFTLMSHTGEPLSLSDLQGKPVLMFFGYTFCPDICPTTLAEFVRVKRDLGEAADNVHFVFVSVDGERDTPEVLTRHLSAFDEDFIGLQGDDATLKKIEKDYGLYYKKNEVQGTSAAYLVDHTAASYLINPEGRLQIIYPYGMSPEVISTDVQAMLQG